MPWVPELFTAPALQSLEEKRHRKFETVPFFDGILTGEVDALTGSFAGEPELYHPVRGRIRGRRAFEAYIADTRAWLAEPMRPSTKSARSTRRHTRAEREFSIWTVTRHQSMFRSRSLRIGSPTAACSSYASTTAAGR